VTWPSDLKFIIDGRNAKKESIRKWTRMIVFSIRHDSQTLDELCALVAYIRPFFHPLNEGNHTEAITYLLSVMSLNLAKRIGIEKGAHPLKKPWKGTDNLSEDQIARLVDTWLPLAFASLRSKESTTSFLASQSVKDLACMSPDLVMPQVCAGPATSACTFTHKNKSFARQ
jgi:hypothetical protein